VAISVGSAGYLAVFLSLPAPVLITAVVLAMGAIAVWGVKESVTFAATMTVIEIGGLLVLILAGFALKTEIVTRMPEIVAVDASPVVLAGLEICKQPT
jgi:amino acid transporter